MSWVVWVKPAWCHGDGWDVSGVVFYPHVPIRLQMLPHCVKMYSKHNKMSQEKGVLRAINVISGQLKTVCRELGLKQKSGTASK